MTNLFVTKRLNDEFKPLEKATDGSCGFDLKSLENKILAPNEIYKFKLGFSMAIKKCLAGDVRSRSGLACKHGVVVVNQPGTIDSDYRGEVCVVLWNTRNEEFVIEKGMRIAQLVPVVVPPLPNEIPVVEDLNETYRGSGGFGSTGMK